MSSTRPPSGTPRPVPASAAKGIAVVAVFVILGVIILWRVPRSGGTGSSSARTTTTAATTTTIPQTTTTAAVSMTGVKILVVNAAGVANAAGKIANQLKAQNLETLPPGNAVQTGANQTSVYYADTFKAAGDKVAQLLGLPAAVGVIDAALIKGGAQGAQVVVMVGKDLATSTSSTAAGGPTTTKAGATTTAKAATSTTTG
jgi:hypothetical protein